MQKQADSGTFRKNTTACTTSVRNLRKRQKTALERANTYNNQNNISMKKFVGNVNGRDYHNRCEFEKAVAEAVKKNDNYISIYSYEKEVPDEDCSKHIPEKENDKIIVTEEDILLPESHIRHDGVVDVTVWPGLTQKLKNCSNKSEVLKMLGDKIGSAYEEGRSKADEVAKLETEIDAMKERLEEADKEHRTKIGEVAWYKLLKSCVFDTGMEIEHKEPGTCMCGDGNGRKQQWLDGVLDEYARGVFRSFMKDCGLFS